MRPGSLALSSSMIAAVEFVPFPRREDAAVSRSYGSRGRAPFGSQLIKRLNVCRYAFDSETLLLLSASSFLGSNPSEHDHTLNPVPKIPEPDGETTHTAL